MKKLLIFFAVLMIAASAHAEENVMKFAYADTSPPLSWLEDGQMRGILIDIADEAVGKRMGIAVSHEGYPWERANHLVKKGSIDALITNGPLRKEWAEHGEEVAIMLERPVYVKAGSSKFEQIKKAKTLEDLRPFRLIGERGSGWAKAHLVDKNFDVHLVAGMDMIYKMLAKGRVDANINVSHIARYHISQLGLKDQIVELPPVSPPLPFHLVVGKKSPFTKIIPRFDETIREMKKDGALERIFDKYR